MERPVLRNKDVLALISVVVPSVSRRERLLCCVDSVIEAGRHLTEGLEIIVVAAGYDEEYLEVLGDRDIRVVALPAPVAVSEARNLGASRARGRYILFIDDDNIVDAHALVYLATALDDQPGTILVGPVMYYGDLPDRIWCAGVHRSRFLLRTHLVTAIRPTVDYAPSEDFPNCFLVRRAAFMRIGGFDSERFPQHYEEADLARRLRQENGGSVYCVVRAKVWHFIAVDLARRLHLKNAEMAYLVARNRAVFTALYGDTVQRWTYVLIGMWLFAAVYLLAALRMKGHQRSAIVVSYGRGMWDGLMAFTSLRSARERAMEPRPHTSAS